MKNIPRKLFTVGYRLIERHKYYLNSKYSDGVGSSVENDPRFLVGIENTTLENFERVRAATKRDTRQEVQRKATHILPENLV